MDRWPKSNCGGSRKERRGGTRRGYLSGGRGETRRDEVEGVASRPCDWSVAETSGAFRGLDWPRLSGRVGAMKRAKGVGPASGRATSLKRQGRGCTVAHPTGRRGRPAAEKGPCGWEGALAAGPLVPAGPCGRGKHRNRKEC